MVKKVLARDFAKLETSVIERLSRDTIVPVISSSNQLCGRRSSLSR